MGEMEEEREKKKKKKGRISFFLERMKKWTRTRGRRRIRSRKDFVDLASSCLLIPRSRKGQQ